MANVPPRDTNTQTYFLLGWLLAARRSQRLESILEHTGL